MIKHVIYICCLAILAGCQQRLPATPSAMLSDEALAKIAFNSADYQAASRLYDQAISQALPTSDLTKLYVEMARTERRLKQPDTALRFLEKIKKPTSISWQLAGRCYLDKKDYKGAEQAFINALRLNPQASVSHNGLGVALSWQSKFKASEQAFVNALSQMPDNRSFLSNRALNLIMLGDTISAIEILTASYQRGQSDSRMRGYLALAFLFNQQEEKARGVLTQDYFGEQLTQVINYFNDYVSNAKHLTPNVDITP